MAPATMDVSVSPKVFLSYALEDRTRVEQIARDLTALGFTVWRPEDAAKPGESLTAQLGEAIRNADAVAVLLSRAALKSPMVSREIAFALADRATNGERLVVPVLLETGVEPPPFLRHLRFLDATSPNAYKESLAALARAIREPRVSRAERARQRLLEREMLEAEYRALLARELDLQRMYLSQSAQLTRTLLWALVAVAAGFGVTALGLSLKTQAIAAFLAGVAATVSVIALRRLMRRGRLK